MSETIRRKRMAVAAAIACIGFIAGAWFWTRITDGLEVPAAGSAVAVGADLARCAECHADIVERFQHSPHLNTLHSAGDERIRARFLDGALEAEGNRPRLSYRLIDEGLILHSGEEPFPYPTTHVFGSGRHALTPVSTRTNLLGETELLEHSVSWYPQHGLGLTIGRSQDVFEGWKRFGHPLDSGTTEDCFGCHTSDLPKKENSLDLEQAVHGVRCNRCHFELDRHLAADGATSHLTNIWRSVSPRDAIRRCGECHRTVEHIHPAERQPDNASLIRFAPVGLELSTCFRQQSELRLDCTACHDPHEAPLDVEQVSLRVCLQCHGEVHQVRCSVQSVTSNCVSCHMPKVELTPLVSFTDHWIRVRTDAEAGAENANPSSDE